jgi:hypothetical protein
LVISEGGERRGAGGMGGTKEKEVIMEKSRNGGGQKKAGKKRKKKSGKGGRGQGKKNLEDLKFFLSLVVGLQVNIKSKPKRGIHKRIFLELSE